MCNLHLLPKNSFIENIILCASKRICYTPSYLAPLWAGCNYKVWLITAWLHGMMCKLHAAQCTLHAAQCTLHAAQCTVHAAQCTLHGAQCTLHAAQCTLMFCQYQMIPTDTKFLGMVWYYFGSLALLSTLDVSWNQPLANAVITCQWQNTLAY